MGRKTSEKTSDLVPQPHGGALKPGGNGKSGGRPKEEWRQWCRDAMSDPAARKALLEVVKDSEHKHFPKVMTLLAAYGYGKPEETVNVNQHPPVSRFPEPIEGTDGWLDTYQPLLHREQKGAQA